MGNRADSDPDLPAVAPKSTGVSLDALRGAVDDNAKLVRTIYVAFLSFCLYIAVLAGSTTHEQLLRDKAPKIPFLDIELPVTGIYFVIPLLLIAFHFELLQQMVFLARTTWQFKARLDAEKLAGPDHIIQLDLLNSSPIVYMLIGDNFSAKARFMMRAMMVVTVFAAPPLLMLVLQGAFLPYHHPWLHSFHGIILFLDCLLAVVYWHKYFNPDVSNPRPLSLRQTGRAVLSCLLISVIILAILLTTQLLILAESGIWYVIVLLATLAASLLTSGMLATGLRTTFCILVLMTALFGSYRQYDGCGDRLFHGLSGNPFLWTAEQRLIQYKSAIPVPPGDDACYQLGLQAYPLWSRVAQQTDPPEKQGPGTDAEGVADDKSLWALLKQSALPTRVIKFNGSLFSFEEMEVIKDGVAVVRRENRGVDLKDRDLRNADFSNAVLHHADMSNANLSHAYLKRAKLNRAKLYDATLHLAELSYAELHDTKMGRAQLPYAYLQGIQIVDSDLEEINLTAADLRHSIWKKVNFKNASLNLATLEKADIRESDMSGTHMRQAHLHGVHMTDVSMNDAKGYQTEFSKAVMTGVKIDKGELEGSNFTEAKLVDVSLRNAILVQVGFSSATLHGVDMSNAEMQESVLSYAVVVGADMSRARLHGAELTASLIAASDLSHAELFGARMDRTELEATRLFGGQLQGASISSVRLEGVDLRRALLSFAGFAPQRRQDLIDRIKTYREDYDETDPQASCLNVWQHRQSLYENSDSALFCQKPHPSLYASTGPKHQKYYSDRKKQMVDKGILCISPAAIMRNLTMISQSLEMHERLREDLTKTEGYAAVVALYLPLLSEVRGSKHKDCPEMAKEWKSREQAFADWEDATRSRLGLSDKAVSQLRRQ